MRFRDKLARFMYGRYGFGYGANDRLNYFLLVVYLILAVANGFIRNAIASYTVSLLCALTVVFVFFRMFSKNIGKRQAENTRFIRIWSKVKSFFKLNFTKVKEIKTNRYRRCPSCRAQLRLPRKCGKHSVVCPACKNRFDVNILF